MGLSKFIKENQKEIVDEWVDFARENIDATESLNLNEVRDHITEMLDRIRDNMEESQSESEREKRSKGKEIASKHAEAALAHGEQRMDAGFDIVELSSEFRALRASVLRLWERKTDPGETKLDVEDIMKFNQAIDEVWMVSLERFHKKMDESKNWFLGILGHDLRNPLAAISGAQQILKLSENLSDKERDILKRSDTSVKRMGELISNLLELTNLRLGSGLSINRMPTDLSKQTEDMLQEFRLTYPHAVFGLETSGSVEGEWDIIRLNQVITNLLANALRHGKPGGPVNIKVTSEGNKGILQVHNEGQPIPEGTRQMIFKGMFVGDPTKESSYGLGLYIVKEIVDGHGGEIEVESTEKAGTTFTIILPKKKE